VKVRLSKMSNGRNVNVLQSIPRVKNLCYVRLIQWVQEVEDGEDEDEAKQNLCQQKPSLVHVTSNVDFRVRW